MMLLYHLEYNALVWFRKTRAYRLYKRFRALQNKPLVGRQAHSSIPPSQTLGFAAPDFGCFQRDLKSGAEKDGQRSGEIGLLP